VATDLLLATFSKAFFIFTPTGAARTVLLRHRGSADHLYVFLEGRVHIRIEETGD
jgi:hypothetical protein